MRHRFKRFTHLRAHGLSKGDEHLTNTLHRVWYWGTLSQCLREVHVTACVELTAAGSGEEPAEGVVRRLSLSYARRTPPPCPAHRSHRHTGQQLVQEPAPARPRPSTSRQTTAGVVVVTSNGVVINATCSGRSLDDDVITLACSDVTTSLVQTVRLPVSIIVFL